MYLGRRKAVREAEVVLLGFAELGEECGAGSLDRIKRQIRGEQ